MYFCGQLATILGTSQESVWNTPDLRKICAEKQYDPSVALLAGHTRRPSTEMEESGDTKGVSYNYISKSPVRF